LWTSWTISRDNLEILGFFTNCYLRLWVAGDFTKKLFNPSGITYLIAKIRNLIEKRNADNRTARIIRMKLRLNKLDFGFEVLIEP